MSPRIAKQQLSQIGLNPKQIRRELSRSPGVPVNSDLRPKFPAVARQSRRRNGLCGGRVTAFCSRSSPYGGGGARPKTFEGVPQEP